MLRSFFGYLSKAVWAQRMVTQWGIARRVASRFVAGETTADAIRVARELNQRGINVSLDHLGENTENSQAAEQAAVDVIQILDEIKQNNVRGNVSIKLSQIGMALDEGLCRKNLAQILEHARDAGIFIRIDMEDHAFTERTLSIFKDMHKAGFNQVGIVIQAYLYRSEADIRQLVDMRGPVRLCKGAYKEPAEVAFPKKSDVDKNYDHLARLLLDGAKSAGCPKISADGRIPPLPAIATHDPDRIEHSKAYAREIGLPKDAFEFQMLYGIRRDLQEQLASEGYLVRVYVPYGTHWYPYLMRRMGERPANVWFIMSNFFRK